MKTDTLHEKLLATGATCHTVTGDQIADPKFKHPDPWVNLAVKKWRRELKRQSIRKLSKKQTSFSA